MIRRSLSVVAFCIPAVSLLGCIGTITSSEDYSEVSPDSEVAPSRSAQPAPQAAFEAVALKDCPTLDFDQDGNGDPITAGRIVEDVYESIGVAINVWGNASRTRAGLGVAFDSDNPTGGDGDLAFSGLGNLLINQEHFRTSDIENGFVAVPDDSACGAVFEFLFDEPVCMKSVVVLDIDIGEDPARIEFFDADDNRVGLRSVDPAGNNERIDVAFAETGDCNVQRATVRISSSGAIDNLRFCRAPTVPRLWTEIYNSGSDDVAHDVAVNSQRGPVVVGESQVGATSSDAIVRAYDALGGFRWAKKIDNGGADVAYGVAVGPADTIYVAGSTSNGADLDLFLRSYDNGGNVNWTRTFDGGGDDIAYDVAVDGAGNVLVAGTADVGSGSDILVRKYDSAGVLVWVRSANVGASDEGFGIATDAGNNVYVAGRSDNGSDGDVWLRKYTATGGELWTRIFDGGADDAATSVATDPSGNPIVAGFATTGGSSDVFVRKYNPSGVTQWTRTFDGGGSDRGNAVATDAAGSVVVSGTVENVTTDGWTRKYDSNGLEQWTELFDRGGADSGNGVAVDFAGTVLSTGSTTGGSSLDLWLTTYRP